MTSIATTDVSASTSIDPTTPDTAGAGAGAPNGPIASPIPDVMSNAFPADAVSGILARQRMRESAARTYARTLPIVPVRAYGSTIVGADGRRYLDCLAGAGTLALGHNHPVAVEAMNALLRSGAPLHTLDIATPEKDAFTEELLSCLPPGLASGCRLLFCGPSGADAVEAAVKLAQTVTGRQAVLAFTGAYHGMTAGALALTGRVSDKNRLPAPYPVVRLPFPHPYRCPFGVPAGTPGPDGATLSARYIRRLLDDPAGGIPTPAAMIVEPVQGEGGVVPAPDGWLRAMRQITRERGIPLILDEVQTGVGRTGAFWGADHSGVTPDIMVMSKAIGGGLPLAVVAYRADLDTWTPGSHAGTFRGNQLAMAAGRATLAFVRSEGLADRAAVVGARMLAGLRGIARDLAREPGPAGCGGASVIGDVRGRGLMIGLEIVDPTAEPDVVGAHPADPELARLIQAECLRRGMIVELGGRYQAVVRLLPPLVITDEEVDRALDILAESVRAASARRRAGARAPEPTG